MGVTERLFFVEDLVSKAFEQDTWDRAEGFHVIFVCYKGEEKVGSTWLEYFRKHKSIMCAGQI